MTLSNRTLAVLVLVWVLGFFYLIFLYFFVYYTSILNIESNVWNFKVELYAKSIAQKFERTCVTQTCSLNNISPFDYTMTITKDGYEVYSDGVDLKWATVVNKSIELKKIISLQNIEKKEVTRENKIELLKLKSKSYKSIYLEWLWILYFDQTTGLDAYFSTGGIDTKIGNFNLHPAEEIQASQIYVSSGDIILSLGNENFVYNSTQNKLQQIDLHIPVLYAKKDWENNSMLDLVTSKGTFVFDEVSGEVTYFTLFSDFVALGKGKYIGYISWKDDARRKNFWFSPDEVGTSPLIIQFDQHTLEKKVLYKLQSEIKKIYAEKEKVFVEDDAGNVSQIEGI